MRFIVIWHDYKFIFKDYRLIFFILSLGLYGSFSSPTPDNPGIIEAIIFCFFILALGYNGLYKAIFDQCVFSKNQKWQISGYILLFYSLFIPLIISLYNNTDVHIVIRDLIGLVFLCLPLLLYPFLKDNIHNQKIFYGLIIFIGLAFSIRVLFLDFSFFSTKEKLLYLANSPLVLFSALSLMMTCLGLIQQKWAIKNLMWASAYIFIALIPLAAMYIDFQRASFMAVGISVILILGICFIKTPIKAFMAFIFIAIIGILFISPLLGVIENISIKTSQVGLNMRQQELMAVWEMATMNAQTLFFGHGWGAQFTSPAVGDLNVSYTHSLLTYMFLKTGLIGLGLTVVYLFFIFEKLLQLVFIEPLKGSALLWPFIIPIFLYASYKSIDYGLVLTLIVMTKKRN